MNFIEAVAELLRRKEEDPHDNGTMAQTGGGMCAVGLRPVTNYIGKNPAGKWYLHVWYDMGAGQPFRPAVSEVLGQWEVMPQRRPESR